jgi:hypothetical protein
MVPTMTEAIKPLCINSYVNGAESQFIIFY